MEALPISPQCNIWWPTQLKIGNDLSKDSLLPPTKIEIVPLSALCWPPVIGASITSAFLSKTNSDKYFISFSSVVLISIHKWLSLNKGMHFNKTSLTDLGDGKHVISIDTLGTSSSIFLQKIPPLEIKFFDFFSSRSWTYNLYPLLIILFATLKPTFPNPTKPTLISLIK